MKLSLTFIKLQLTDTDTDSIHILLIFFNLIHLINHVYLHFSCHLIKTHFVNSRRTSVSVWMWTYRGGLE